MSVMAGISAGLGIIGGIADIGASVGNYFNQKNQLDWQKYAQRETWKREDTATQRRAADLQAAGLSKTLAAGSAAQTSAPINVTAPELKLNAQEKAVQMMNMLAQKKNIAHTEAEIARVNQQKNLLAKQELLTTANLSEKLYNLQFYQNMKLPTNATGTAKEFAQYKALLEAALASLGSGSSGKGKVGTTVASARNDLLGDMKLGEKPIDYVNRKEAEPRPPAWMWSMSKDSLKRKVTELENLIEKSGKSGYAYEKLVQDLSWYKEVLGSK